MGREREFWCVVWLLGFGGVVLGLGVLCVDFGVFVVMSVCSCLYEIVLVRWGGVSFLVKVEEEGLFG